MNLNYLRTIVITLALGFAGIPLSAQNTMRITYNDGSTQDIQLDKVRDITFFDTPEQSDTDAGLIGTWVWGKLVAGYYEVITFNKDHTYIGDDCYFEYGFNTTTYGTYVHSGIMLNLRSNGYGYMRIFRWFVTSLTDNALEVMTQTGPYTYYRLQSETYRVKAGEPLSLSENMEVAFADGVTAKVQDGKLYGMQAGTTYIILMDKDTNTSKAYILVVEE